MKKSVTLVGLTLVSALFLGACGNQKENATHKADHQRKTEQVQKKGVKKADSKTTDNDVTKSEEANKSAEGAVTTSQNDQANHTQTAPSNAASGNEAELTEVPIPQELVGTWSGNAGNTSSVEFTVTADGTIHTIVEVDRGTENGYVDDNTAVMTKLVQVAPNVYAIEGYTGSDYAVLPGILGIGGVGETKPGFMLSNGQYTPILWTAGIGEAIDYSKWSPFPVTYQKGELSASERAARDQTAANSNY